MDNTKCSSFSPNKLFQQFIFFFNQKICVQQNVDENKTQSVTKLPNGKNLIFDKTQKLKLWKYSKTLIFTNLKNSNCDKTQIVRKLKLWQLRN